MREEPPDPGLIQAAEARLARTRGRIQELEFDGRHYVLKRVRAKARSRYQQWAVRLLCRLFFPRLTAPGNASPRNGWRELERVRMLRNAGQNVPRVVATLPDAVMYTHCGKSVEQHLRHQDPAERRTTLHTVTRNLAAFHRAGYWHGGAQLRNVLFDGEHYYRVDFEEDLEQVLSLELAQVYDLAQHLADATTWVQHEDQAEALGLELLHAYQQLHWSPRHTQALRGVARLLAPLHWLGCRLRHARSRDVRRGVAMARVTRSGYRHRPAAAPTSEQDR
ncbi:hypothetical protein [Thioalkalivibrio sp. ALJT]|uniref:hypothetical protein n=1 Tax=Thioalkalivibrio sp. ALJT TaxID=1158146 RepID=UPI0003705CA7|nr:hypothetical protein [Thioalkalivibrio sp. ALJT]